MVLERLLILEASARSPPTPPHRHHQVTSNMHMCPCPRCKLDVKCPMTIRCLSQERIDSRFSAIETKLGIEASINAIAPPVVQAELTGEELLSPNTKPPGKAKSGVVFVVPHPMAN